MSDTLRTDSERLSYLDRLTKENGECWLQQTRDDNGETKYQLFFGDDEEEPPLMSSIRDAIDAAMKEPT